MSLPPSAFRLLPSLMHDFHNPRLSWRQGHLQPAAVQRAQLTATLSPLGSANAVLLAKGAAGSLATLGGVAIEVHDVLAFRGADGDKCYVVYMADMARYEVIGMLGAAGWIKFQLPSALTATQTTKSGCTVLRYWDGSNPGATVDVENELGFEGDAGSEGYARWDPSYNSGAGAYLIIQLECPTGGSS